MIRTYLEWLADAALVEVHRRQPRPQGGAQGARPDHYDIEKVKDRILEFLAVRKLKPDARSSILCFVGPPGVGKTSLGKSIAAAMGREFERISVGGVRDESEIRGHRRTYIGAMPGTIIRALRDAGSNNPVLMIDEIDKMGADFRGDPSSAMLEVLDPEQNSSFRDHYLDLPFDLSRVLFITTANQLDPIPAPLRDRMEVIELVGLHRGGEARDRQALPGAAPGRARTASGKSKIEFTDDALREIIERLHARGRRAQPRARDRRDLPQGRARVRRGHAQVQAHRAAEGGRRAAGQAPRSSPRRRPAHRRARRGHRPGLDAGRRRRAVRGGHRLPGRGQAAGHRPARRRDEGVGAAALSYVKRTTCARWATDVPDDWFRENDVHVHVPAGAIPKDGPSAGITMATALASLVTGRPVRSDTAMTGEITLTGQVLPIGGLKEKALAAQRAEITRVIAPRRNEADLEEFPPNLLKDMEFVFVDTVDEVLEAALEPGQAPARKVG